MSLTELKEMINSTINSNETCEINAKSLNLALNSIVEFAESVVENNQDDDIPPYWAGKILTELQNYIEENNSTILKLQSELNSLKTDVNNVSKDDVALFYNGTADYTIINLTKNKVLEIGGAQGIIYNPNTKELIYKTHCSDCVITFNDLYQFYYGTNAYSKKPYILDQSRLTSCANVYLAYYSTLFLESTTSDKKYELNLKRIS